MNCKITATLLIFLSTFLASCAIKLATPTEEDAKRGADKYPNYDLATLQQDKALFEQKCTTCHGLKDPTRKSAKKWPLTVEVMARRAARKRGKEISETEQLAITRYLVTMSTSKKKHWNINK